jgi:hypothetical protein
MATNRNDNAGTVFPCSDKVFQVFESFSLRIKVKKGSRKENRTSAKSYWE